MYRDGYVDGYIDGIKWAKQQLSKIKEEHTIDMFSQPIQATNWYIEPNKNEIEKFFEQNF